MGSIGKQVDDAELGVEAQHVRQALTGPVQPLEVVG